MSTGKFFYEYSKRLSLSFICCLFLTPYLGTPCSSASDSTDFIRRKGDKLVRGSNEQAIYLRGVNMCACVVAPSDGNDWLYGTCHELRSHQSATPVTNWYQEKHFQYLAEIGFNTIRVMLNYRVFEDDATPGSYKQSGWDFLDFYIQWAKNNNIYLILDMHTPQGGLQPTGGGGACFWDTINNQSRLIDLWQAIAQRYADEPTIAAFDLLNEPTPTSSPSQWQMLAQQIVDVIRTVDQNHLIIIERVNWIFDANGSSPLEEYNLDVLSSFQISVDDDNIIYDYHFYAPTGYSLQNEGSNPDEGTYPDENVIETAKDGTTMPRNKNYLEYEISLESRNHEPMFVGEWGPNGSTFNETKGGYTYVEDTLDLFNRYSLHWTYYSMWNLYEVECCETGVTCCSGDNPTLPHSELIDIFSSYFNDQSTTTTTNLFTTSTTSTSSQLTTTTALPSTTTTSSQPCPAETIFGEQSEETELLRYFRDNVLSQTTAGQEIIELYYRWSPAIVKAMEADGEFKYATKEMVEEVLGLIGENVK